MLRRVPSESTSAESKQRIDLRKVPATEYRFTHGAWYDDPWVSTDVMVTLLGGLSAEEILEEMPDLTREDITACLVFARNRLDHAVVAA